ncbi:MAG TPA: prolipoprotein diacylglyceryl transferase [Segeticoccus sp.]|nr:prolipoprotein diacylglyceryl transferase [Segeticoccus sp.]
MIASLPSPVQGVWWIGDLPIRAYALCILAGILVACWIAQRRLLDRGGTGGEVLDIAMWAVPFGIIGGRLYHVATTYQPYFGPGGHPIDALKIWHGGLGIWGAIALGGVGAWIACRRRGIAFLDFADAAAPGVLIAQALGRWGNWFNNELYGHRTDVPWALEIHCWNQAAGHAVTCPGSDSTVLGYFQPTFLYESLWCVAIALAIVLVDRRVRLGRGRAFALYIMLYPVGRVFFELMRTDTATHVLGLRINIWTCLLVFLAGLGLFLWFGRRHPDGVRGTTSSDPAPVAADREADERAADDEATEETDGTSRHTNGAVPNPGPER